MFFRQLIDNETKTYTYLIANESTSEAIIFDSVLNHANQYIKLLGELGFTLKFIFETHIHADHITAAYQLKQNTGAEIIVPEDSCVSNADRVIGDDEVMQLGKLSIKAIATPGHTNCGTCYLINNQLLLSGDTLLIRGCGRTDFQNGSAEQLYDSITEKLFSLADNTIVYPAHDYNGNTCSSISEERKYNPRLSNKSKAEFIEIMDNLNLPKPKHIDIAVPANLRCGEVD